jgi:hypothetical protein
MAASRSFHLVTPVWGADFTRTFLDVTLPCLLSPGNIPALPPGSCVYKIFTSDDDRARIVESPAFRTLSSLATVELRTLEQRDDNPYVQSSNCYRAATREASDAGAAIIYLIPDMIFADGGLAAIARFLGQGKRAVLVAGLRTVKESIVPEVLARFRAGGAITVPPRPLVGLAMRHMHPVMQHHMYDEESAGFNPSFFCWRVPEQGFVVHCAHLQPVAVDLRGQRATSYGTIDDDLLFDLGLRPDELAYAEDSDDLLWFELSPRGRIIEPPSGRRLWEILRWLNGATYPHQRDYLRRTLRIRATDATSAEWRAAEARGARVVDAILSAFDLEQARIARDPGQYAVPAAVKIGEAEAAGDAASAIRRIMDVAGAGSVLDGVIEALDARARAYLGRGASRRLDRSPLKLAAAATIVGSGKALRWLLRLVRRR